MLFDLRGTLHRVGKMWRGEKRCRMGHLMLFNVILDVIGWTDFRHCRLDLLTLHSSTSLQTCVVRLNSLTPFSTCILWYEQFCIISDSHIEHP